jgi:hypothetical protein
MTKMKEFYKSHKNSDFFILLNISSNRLSMELVTGSDRSIGSNGKVNVQLSPVVIRR